ncbi:hypothetical protein PR202_ga27754 [Eleusine coracana subsp. coracana]|uniref:Uncharacterized protein n=1 Tax=Eleusine coracana subsp. coracana TaxID=191504 RepID=A0AAV5DGS3_ELECO|nr:hypothetical protein PR202_ga27754 [Eleusine coracana subsp. coracana]
MSQSPAAPPPAPIPTSPWHSPVPYLFGGLAAMLGLIALALLILACSYWKLNSYLGAGDTDSTDPEAAGGDGTKSPAVAATASPAAFADLVAVVMAGEKTPTFLAAPIVHRIVDNIPTVPAGDQSSTTEDGEENSGKDNAERDRPTDHV